MKFKVGDKVKITQGVGTIVWMRPRKIPQDGDLSLPLVDGPNWEFGVMVRNPPECPFPYYIYCAFEEYTKHV